MQTKMICLYASAMSSAKTARTNESRFIEYPIQVNSIKCDKMKTADDGTCR